MGAKASQEVDESVEDVFAWFSRPGAITRLTPPWQPISVKQEAASLQDGTAILGLPGGMRWVARHQPDDFTPNRRFVDKSVVEGLRSCLTGSFEWRHEHLFDPIAAGSRITDSIDSPAPRRLLTPMLVYRHSQLAGDLAAHRRAAHAGMGPMTIAVTGSSGLVGTQLCAFLTGGGHRVIRLVRRPVSSVNERQWHPQAPIAGLLDGCDGVIHLAGAGIAGRFTKRHRLAVERSRIWPTRRLAEEAVRSKVPVFVSASAIGVYGADGGDAVLSDDAALPESPDFLATVVKRWEEAARASAGHSTRFVQIRTGLVQTAAGGLLGVMRQLFLAGLGGPLADGRPWRSWIGLDDLLDIYHRALWDEEISGPVNAVAPTPVRERDYARTLAEVLHRPALLPVPAAGIRAVLGPQAATEFALASQRVVPTVLISRGHEFRHPDLPGALAHTLGRTRETRMSK